LWSVGVVVGLASERSAFGWDDLTRWIPDLVVGLVFVGCGAHAVSRSRGTAMLLVAVGLSWFAANVWPEAAFVHRGVLVHLLVAYPGWRPRSPVDVVAVAVGYVTALVLPVWQSEAATVVLALALVAVVARSVVVSAGSVRRARRTALVGTLVLAGGLFAGTLIRLSGGDDAVTSARLVYEVALCAVALWLTAELPRREPSAVADLVVELSAAPSGTLRDALAVTLGDPSLEVGFWDGQASYRDIAGRVVEVPPARADRSVTYVARASAPFAVLVHDVAVLDEPVMVESVAVATRLTTVNAELQAVVRGQLEKLSASRRRLVSAADDERRRLDERLRDGAERSLLDLADLLETASSVAVTDSVRVERARTLLGQTLDDLGELAAGLHPREVSEGLAAALAALAARSPVPVDVDVEGAEPDLGTRTAVYYVCAEALANTVKHASATAVTIHVVATRQRVTTVVADDGVGGADVADGSGLRGLIDRVEALDGRIDIDSPVGGGTRISVELPVPSPTAAVVATGVAAEPAAANRSESWSMKRTGHDAGGSSDLYGRSHRAPERSPR
jgi:signal transduction histidine kinase